MNPTPGRPIPFDSWLIEAGFDRFRVRSLERVRETMNNGLSLCNAAKYINMRRNCVAFSAFFEAKHLTMFGLDILFRVEKFVRVNIEPYFKGLAQIKREVARWRS